MKERVVSVVGPAQDKERPTAVYMHFPGFAVWVWDNLRRNEMGGQVTHNSGRRL